MSPKAPADWNLAGTWPWVVKDGQGPQLGLEVPQLRLCVSEDRRVADTTGYLRGRNRTGIGPGALCGHK